ncbi:hypothetical protein C1646_783639 [Rhizophagus diaphanus]|nr:hypothetical protein C1646_783639 [Rhizophagus diaphanus] [Rhizophagus sp. MUCL 43196]
MTQREIIPLTTTHLTSIWVQTRVRYANAYTMKSHRRRKRDNFLDEAHKKSVGEDIRRRNKEKKLQRESANQDSISDTAYVNIPTVDSKVSNDLKPVNRISENSELSRDKCE